MRLLLVEDEKRMAQALCEILRLEKYDVDHFANGCDLIAESTVFLSTLHSCAINRLDGKQQFFSLSLWRIRQQ